MDDFLDLWIFYMRPYKKSRTKQFRVVEVPLCHGVTHTIITSIMGNIEHRQFFGIHSWFIMGIWQKLKRDMYVKNAGEFHPVIWGDAQNAALITASRKKSWLHRQSQKHAHGEG
jgi:hypothetical protein